MRRIRSTYRRPISDRERLEDDKDAKLINERAESIVEELMDSFINPDSSETIAAAIERDQRRRFEAFENWRKQNRARKALGLSLLPRPAGV